MDIIGGSNYVDVVQGSSEWFTNRILVITASKLPTLLGMNGYECDAAWFWINSKLDESTYQLIVKNFERGQLYEKAALGNFTEVSCMGSNMVSDFHFVLF